MRDTNTAQTWFLAREAAEYCRISPRTLARWRSAGRIRHYGGRYFRDDLDRAVRNGEPVLEKRDVVRSGDQFLTDDPGDTRRTGFAPGELDTLRDEIRRNSQEDGAYHIVFGQLDYCPVSECDQNGQTHEHITNDVIRALPD